jgi:hypothetical protein
LKIKKSDLKGYAKTYGDNAVIEIAQGVNTVAATETPKHVQEEIVHLFRDILEEDDLKSVGVDTLLECLRADALLERFAYRKNAVTGANKEFMKMKGTRGQIAKETEKDQIKSPNPYVGFKCLSYSVTESSGIVEITIVKKCADEITLGYRTIADTAFAPKDFTHVDEQITFGAKEVEKKSLFQL